MAQTREGVGVTDRNFHRPAGTILCEDILRAQGEIGREKRLDRWGWVVVAGLFGAALALTPYDHDPQESPRQHRVPAPEEPIEARDVLDSGPLVSHK
jgi:hypothetical protein